MQKSYLWFMLFMREAIVSFLLCISIGNALSQGYCGKIISENGAEEGVAIQIQNSGKGALSNKAGNFCFKEELTFPTTLIISKVGFKRKTITLKSAADFPTDALFIDIDYLNLAQFVVTEKRELALQTVPIIPMHTIGSLSFELTQSQTLSEGLVFSPGIRVENNCQNCGFSQVRMNGLPGPYTQILVDGRPVFSAMAGIYGLELLPSQMIERVEVMRGGGSVVHGGNGIAGTLNIVTKEPENNAAELSNYLGWIAPNAFELNTRFNASFIDSSRTYGIHLYGGHRDRDAWDANNDGITEITRIKQQIMGFSGFLKTGKQSTFRLSGFVSEDFRRGGSHLDREPHQSALAEQLKQNMASAHLNWNTTLPGSSAAFEVYAAFQHLKRASYYGSGGRIIADDEPLTEADIRAMNAYGRSLDISYNGGFLFQVKVGQKHRINTGLEIRGNHVWDKMPGYARSLEQMRLNPGCFAEWEWAIKNNFRLVSGFRYDLVEMRGTTFFESDTFLMSKYFLVPITRLGFSFDPIPGLRLRAGYSTGYRAPQAFDEDLHIALVGGEPLFIALSPNLRTEYSHSGHFSFEWNGYRPRNEFRVLADLFYTRLIHPFVLGNLTTLPSGTGVMVKRNGDAAQVYGLNTEFEWTPGKKLEIRLGLTLQQANYETPQEIWSSPTLDTVVLTSRLLRTPSVYGYLTLNYVPVPKLQLSLSSVYTGSMVVPKVEYAMNGFTKLIDTRGFIEINLRAARKFFIKKQLYWEPAIGVQNILNEFQQDFDLGVTRDAGYVYGPMRPRTFFVQLNLGF
jgi:outer membrane receptor for ferrienterochelin and colicins